MRAFIDPVNICAYRLDHFRGHLLNYVVQSPSAIAAKAVAASDMNLPE